VDYKYVPLFAEDHSSRHAVAAHVKGMVRFSNQEYFDILGVFHRANGNAALAGRIYQELYPDRRQPSEPVFGRVHGNFIATGSQVYFPRPTKTPLR